MMTKIGHKMKLLKTSIIFLFVVHSLYGCAQQGKEIVIAIKQASDSSVEDNLIVLLKEGCTNIKILDLNRNIEDFKYLGNFNLGDNRFLFLFSEYSSPAGLTKYYYFDSEKFLLYKSDFFSETDFPQLFSLDIVKRCIYYVSINKQYCGEILSKKVLIEECTSKYLNASDLKVVDKIVVN